MSEIKNIGEEITKRMNEVLVRIGGRPGECDIDLGPGPIVDPVNIKNAAINNPGLPIFIGSEFDMLYIKDHYYSHRKKRNKHEHDKEVASHPNRCYVSGNKIHFYWCGTLENMKIEQREARYRGEIQARGDKRTIDLSDENNVETRLAWCKHCISIFSDGIIDLDFDDKGCIAEYSNAQEIIKYMKLEYYDEISDEKIRYVLEGIIQRDEVRGGKEKQRSPSKKGFIKIPVSKRAGGSIRGTSSPSGYPYNWNRISKAFRRERGFICEECKVNCSGHPSLMDTHHKNRDKSNCN